MPTGTRALGSGTCRCVVEGTGVWKGLREQSQGAGSLGKTAGRERVYARLADAILTADRPLGTYTATTGLLTDPTELWACAHPCL
ncbi:hypothetical protein ACH4EC_37205 [Streptomyces anulatus]